MIHKGSIFPIFLNMSHFALICRRKQIKTKNDAIFDTNSTFDCDYIKIILFLFQS